MKHSSPYKNVLILFIVVAAVVSGGCNSGKEIENPMFELLDSKRTGLDFSNDLAYDRQFNLFKYIYFYNGSGVGAGDFNNDGRIDLFFGSNQNQNKLFLNDGELKFRDVTKEASVPDDGGWSTGISVVDINNDGLLDVYVCRVGQFETLHSRNQFLINTGINKNGIPVFVDRAKEYGLDFSGFSTQAAFFDYDNDSDLDMFLMNHSVHQNGTFQPRNNFTGTSHPLSGDRIFRNDGNIFTDVTVTTGINSTAIGYGLGIAIADINLDGYPDIYIGNDFHENDYLYINRKNGTFSEEESSRLMHTSQFSMGVDVADVNNDALPEIISMDMLPYDPYILKRSLGEDPYDLFYEKLQMGYSYQYTRNNLQFNRGNGNFSETGLYSGIAATDWSWAPLWMDFDNDGLKDLFISNGIPKRMNDIDYINFVSDGEVQKKIQSDDMQDRDMSLMDKFPEIRIPNKFYVNKGNMSFSDQASNISGDLPAFSNGAVYADLDNDGDLDVVVNNIDDPVFVYENKTIQNNDKSFLRLNLAGPEKNRNAVGASVIVFSGDEVRTYEKFPARGFLSSMEIPMHLGLKNTRIDSILLVWPDHGYEKINRNGDATEIKMVYQAGLPKFDFSNLSKKKQKEISPVQDITRQTGLDFFHKENHFVEFDREPLIPHSVSTEGPALAVADINGDGLDDVFIGAARNQKSGLFIQQHNGNFTRLVVPALERDSIYEDIDACWADINNDGHTDLVVASGGNEFYGKDEHNTPRIYLNDGKAGLARMPDPFSELYITASSVAPSDFNGDGYTDLFIGARAEPWEYGQVPKSCLLLNNKNGKFTDVTKEYANDLVHAGLVTQAQWLDLDGDGDQDLLVSLEWGGIDAYINTGGHFAKKSLTSKKGWWNFVLPADIDGDGDLDLVAGNLGLNSRLKASETEPVRLYHNDFDGNGKKEQLLTYYVNGREIPFASKAELEKQMPVLKKKFLLAENFAKATLPELFGSAKLKNASVLTADYFSNAVIINNGNLDYEIHPLPWLAQLTSFRTALVVNANNDSLPDILMAGNFYDNNVEMGRYDADYGMLLINRGKGSFTCSSLNDLAIKGQVRHIRKVMLGNKETYILARNNDSAMMIEFNGD